jgi:DNA-binding NarL/FixJ family response regulator
MHPDSPLGGRPWHGTEILLAVGWDNPRVPADLLRVDAPYKLTLRKLGEPDALEAALRERSPRMLLIDADLCLLLGLSALRQLHRLHPETDWLIGWDEPSPRWIETIVHSRARGGIEWHDALTELPRALDTIMAGGLWFPRRVLQWLYGSLIGTEPEQDEDASSPHTQWPLTVREAEALALAGQGFTNKQIAHELEISVNTVKKHLASAFDKRGLRSRRQTMG